jgi:transposase InsO family protein
VETGIDASVGSVGNSYDNALAETINGLYKTEAIHRGKLWRTVDAVEHATLVQNLFGYGRHLPRVANRRLFRRRAFDVWSQVTCA